MNFTENNNLIASVYENKMAVPDADAKGIDTVNAIWKNNFNSNNNNNTSTKVDDEPQTKISWGALNNNNNDKIMKNGHDSDNSNSNESNGKLVEVEKYSNDDVQDGGHDTVDAVASPSHHARRPMNAFLIFCKKHRPIVRQKFPTLENRGVTRILGEWWSLLDSKDKEPHTKLAKEYKDAFFNANPDFKWYKLPAPPLRTLPTRPNKVEPISPVAPMNPHFPQMPANPASAANSNSSQVSGDFTPGKLADESQLGMLSSLFNSNSFTNHKTDENPHNHVMVNDTTPIAKDTQQEPPKPLKKRLAAEMDKSDTSKLVRNLFEQETPEIPGPQGDTRQDPTSDEGVDVTNGRKSIRKGKGNRYADIMANGKLIKNKRNSLDKPEKPSTDVTNQNNKLELNSTIKKLQERLLSSSLQKVELTKENDTQPNSDNLTKSELTSDCPIMDKGERTRTISEVSELSDMADYSKAIPSFDLESRIAQLPNLSYDTYIQRKQERRKLPKGGKKTKQKKQVPSQNHETRKRTYQEALLKVETNGRKIDEKQTGSKKRKNKHNITHLKNLKPISGTNIPEVTCMESDLSGLNTLADAALKLSNNNNSEVFPETNG